VNAYEGGKEMEIAFIGFGNRFGAQGQVPLILESRFQELFDFQPDCGNVRNSRMLLGVGRLREHVELRG